MFSIRKNVLSAPIRKIGIQTITIDYASMKTIRNIVIITRLIQHRRGI